MKSESTLQILPSTAQLMKQFGIIPKKSLGQNFLLNPEITQRLVCAVPELANSTVLEIGAGAGILTRALLAQQINQVVVVERDRSCLQLLQYLSDYYSPRLHIHIGDALQIDEKELLSVYQQPYNIVANLPYNIATPLLLKWLQKAHIFQHFILMFQREVAERLCALPNTKAYGKLSILTQLSCKVTKLFTLGPQAFFPPPKVDSTVVHLQIQQPLSPQIWQTLEQIINVFFLQRRKTLHHILHQAKFSCNKELLCQILQQQQIDLQQRPENLTPQQYLEITYHLIQNQK